MDGQELLDHSNLQLLYIILYLPVIVILLFLTANASLSASRDYTVVVVPMSAFSERLVIFAVSVRVRHGTCDTVGSSPLPSTPSHYIVLQSARRLLAVFASTTAKGVDELSALNMHGAHWNNIRERI